MKCTYMIERRRILGRLFRNICTHEASCAVKIWSKDPLFGREPDWQAPRCEEHRLCDVAERALARRLVEIPLVTHAQLGFFT